MAIRPPFDLPCAAPVCVVGVVGVQHLKATFESALKAARQAT